MNFLSVFYFVLVIFLNANAFIGNDFSFCSKSTTQTYPEFHCNNQSKKITKFRIVVTETVKDDDETKSQEETV